MDGLHVRIPCLLLLLASTGACQRAMPAGGDEPTAASMPNVSVTVAPVVRTTLHGYVTGWGSIAPESATATRPPAQAAIAAPVAGRVAAIECREGQRVPQGATLFHLDSRIADVAVERARHAVEFAERVVERQERLGPGEATSQRAYQDAQQQLMAAQAELDAAEVQRQFLDVKAPIAGTITRVNATLGDAIDPSIVLAQLIDMDRLVVNAAVRSVDVGRVAEGQRVELSPGRAPDAPADDASDPVVTARVEYIGAQVDSASDTVLVRARLPSASGLRPGQFVDVRILTEERPEQLAVPTESIVQGPDGPEVALVDGDVAVRTPVTTGLTENGLTQVQGPGVREAGSVVVEGAYGLPPRARVTVTRRRGVRTP